MSSLLTLPQPTKAAFDRVPSYDMMLLFIFIEYFINVNFILE